MIPISDADVHRRRRPIVNIGLIALNSMVFIYELSLGGIDRDIFFFQYGLIPVELSSGNEFAYVATPAGPKDITAPIPTWGTAFSSMFMHGGWMHFMGNMLYLWVFGDNIEDRLGHVKYLLFYLAAGVAATWVHVTTNLDSETPLIGASGAISGVLAAYLLAYPFNRVTTVVFIFFITVIRVPALFFLGFWFILQLFSGIGSLGAAGGVAYMAHVGGFVAGLLLMGGYKLVVGEPIWPRAVGRSWRQWR